MSIPGWIITLHLIGGGYVPPMPRYVYGSHHDCQTDANTLARTVNRNLATYTIHRIEAFCSRVRTVKATQP